MMMMIFFLFIIDDLFAYLPLYLFLSFSIIALILMLIIDYFLITLRLIFLFAADMIIDYLRHAADY